MKPFTLSIQAFCGATGLGRTKTYELITEKRLETIKVGRRTLITMASAEALIKNASADVEPQR